jgi:AbiV family abortive infection protein
MTFERLQAIRAACLRNAEDLVNSAKNLLGTGVDHICYHLSVPALEEIGKATLMQSKFHLDKYKDTEEPYSPDTEDHVKNSSGQYGEWLC